MNKVLQITDTHLFASDEGELRGTRTSETLEWVLEHVRHEHPDTRCILATGDLVQQETAEAYERFVHYFGRFDIPVLCLPGNHDDPALMRQVLSRPPFHLETRFALGAWDLIQLDSHIPGSPAGEVGQAQLEELDGLLQAQPERPTLVAVHHQPVPVGTPWLDGVGLRDGDALLACLERHPQVKTLIWGHVHQPSEQRHGHIQLLGTPSTCAQFLPGSEDFAIDPEAPPAYRVLWLGEDGRFENELVQLHDAVSHS
ncbi:3',5'-cyclic-AMP phosphodiesterase [Natronospira bacteriovora]|uniref:3',5'-cyclic-AMP phosphodiesterase n=1 Tax=Natronospira bacteriovora TaxID=3069753 RepID=A0ABU0W6B4_9GAMM|nr:3',5'-cyclic-AMP phosphodiesterase [Natronospira sp. AB-CW4]MDQ2069567.1 3',5'-cyclic-AMP phosphodiesterase [Natronospira sp. AB-CW4]